MSRSKRIYFNEPNRRGGCDLLIDVLKKRGIPEIIDCKLPCRKARAEYSYSDAIITWHYTNCNDGDRAENIYSSQNDLLKHPRFGRGMSPDTFLYALKELAVESDEINKKLDKDLEERYFKGKAKLEHEVNFNFKLNELMLDILIRLGLLKPGVKYVLDYDTTVIQTKIFGGRKYYHGNGKKGYSPAVAMINQLPVFIQNRNGDSSPSFYALENLKIVLEMMKSRNIDIDYVRVDSIAYDNDIVDYLNSIRVKYVTRCENPAVKLNKGNVEEWSAIGTKKGFTRVGETTFDFGNGNVSFPVFRTIQN